MPSSFLCAFEPTLPTLDWNSKTCSCYIAHGTIMAASYITSVAYLVQVRNDGSRRNCEVILRNINHCWEHSLDESSLCAFPQSIEYRRRTRNYSVLLSSGRQSENATMPSATYPLRTATSRCSACTSCVNREMLCLKNCRSSDSGRFSIISIVCESVGYPLMRTLRSSCWVQC